MWTFAQTSGQLLRDGTLIGVVYSGHGAGRNNPRMQDIHNVGPIPQGTYTIGPAENGTRLGDCVLALEPDTTTAMYGRLGFFIHGDSIKRPGAGVASHGCLIAPLAVRQQIARSGDDRLTVVADVPESREA